MINYILQMAFFQLLFLAMYDLFLKKETFFNSNRLYLLLTPILGIVLPLIKIAFIQQNIPSQYYVDLPTVIITADPSEKNSVISFFFQDFGWKYIWYLGMIFSLGVFGIKLYKILKLGFLGKRERLSDFILITLPGKDTAFSFFGTIFLGENISKENKNSIIVHEKIHIEQKHSLDLLFFEMLRIIFWYNPIVYLFQKRIAALHEYIADAKVTAQKDKKQYYQNLLSQVFQTEKISFINTFFNQSLIKKRIVMLQKSKSRKLLQLKYLLLMPIMFGMLVYTSCSDEPKTEESNAVAQSDSEVMNKITELAEAIQKKGEMTPEEEKALKFLTTEAQPGEKVYTSVQEYLEETKGEDISVPFGAIEKAPIYPGCSGDNETIKLCMSQNIANLVNENFNVSLGKQLNLVGRQKIAVQFKIDKTGKIVDVRARAAKPELEAEAIRVIEKLPQMQPGEQKGEKVGVLYSLPIVFDVE